MFNFSLVLFEIQPAALPCVLQPSLRFFRRIIKQTPAGLAFPLFIVLLVPLRKTVTFSVVRRRSHAPNVLALPRLQPDRRLFAPPPFRYCPKSSPSKSLTPSTARILMMARREAPGTRPLVSLLSARPPAAASYILLAPAFQRARST